MQAVRSESEQRQLRKANQDFALSGVERVDIYAAANIVSQSLLTLWIIRRSITLGFVMSTSGADCVGPSWIRIRSDNFTLGFPRPSQRAFTMPTRWRWPRASTENRSRAWFC